MALGVSVGRIMGCVLLWAGLFDWVAQYWGVTVATVVPTHFHQDCMGGLVEAHRRGAVSHALERS